MPWLSRNNFTPTDKLHADDLNNLANDQRTWGGDVNGGGYTLSNVHIIEAAQYATSAVTSVFGRTGAVVAMSGDYTPAQVGAVPLARQVLAGAGMTGGGVLTGDVTLNAAVQSFGSPPRTGAITLTATDITNAGGVLTSRRINTNLGSGLTGGGTLAGDLTLLVVPDSTNQQVQVMSQGSLIGAPRPRINFVSGGGALVTVQEVSANNRIDVTIASSGSAAGMVDPTQIQGDLIVRGLSAPPTRLPIGTDGQVLTADHLQPQSVKWATPALVAVTSVFSRTGAVVAALGDYSAAQVTNAVDQTGSYNNPPWIASLPWAKVTNAPVFLVDPTVAKGDLIVKGSTTTTRLPAGASGTVLTSDSAATFGVRWGAIPVTSVFGRIGDVVAMADDYDVSQVTGAVPKTTTINTVPGSGLQGGGNLSGNLSLSVAADSSKQQIQVLLGGAPMGQRSALNFHSGAGVALSISDSTLNNWVDITVASTGSGSGGGMVDPTSAAGDLIVRGASLPAPPVALPLGTNGQVLTVDTSLLVGMKWAMPISGGAGSQSPWVGDVDAAAHKLNNVAGIGANVAANPATARVYALINSSEEGFAAKSNLAAGVASASVTNDVGDALRMRSYGSGYVGATPSIATLEASNILALFANSAEVMRLKAGRALIGTTTDDGINKLQVNGKIKSLTGGFVFPDSTIQTTAYTSASVPVTSVFTRTGAIIATAGDYTAALVTNAVDSSSTYSNPSWISSLAWSKITGAPALLVDPTTTKGDLIARGAAAPATRLAVSATNGWVLTADSAQPLGVKWAAVPPSPQTPWASDIDGAGHALNNTGAIHVQGGVNPTSGAGIELSYQAGQAYILAYDRGTSGYMPMQIVGSGVQLSSTPNALLLQPGGGNVGIGGVGVPSATVDVQGGAGAVCRLRSSGSATSNNTQLRFWGSKAADDVWAIGPDILANGSKNFHFYSFGYANVALTIRQDNGYVGIGTATPNSQFELGGYGAIAMQTGNSTAYVVHQYLANSGQDCMSLACNYIRSDNNAGFVASGALGTAEIAITAAGVTPVGAIYFRTGTVATAPVRRMMIDSNGRVGIGDNTPAIPFDVYAHSGAPTSVGASTAIMRVEGDQGGNCLDIGIYPAPPYSPWIQGADRNTAAATYPIVLQPLGNYVGIGKQPSYAIDCAGDCNITGTYRVNGAAFTGSGISYQFNAGAGSGPYTFLNLTSTGSINPQDLGATGNTKTIAWNTASDIMLKRNVQALTGGLPQIMQLRPITAEWNGLSNTREGEKLCSVIAQEVKEVIPEAVYSYRAVLRPGDEELTELLGLDQLAITCHLILAIQQLEKRLKALEQKVN